MTTPQLDRIRSHCQRLRLYRIEAELSTLLEQAAKRELAYSDFVDEMLGVEVRSKAEKHLAMRTSMARFPFHKTLESFDFKFQPSIDPKVIRELATGRFIESGDNVLLLGPPGRRQDASRRGSRPQGLRAGCPDAVHDGDRAHRDPRQGPRRGSTRREAQAPRAAPAADHRRDRLHPDRPPRRQSLLPAGLAVATSAAPSSSPATRASARGARSSATPSSPRRSSIASSTTRSPSTSAATATA